MGANRSCWQYFAVHSFIHEALGWSQPIMTQAVLTLTPFTTEQAHVIFQFQIFFWQEVHKAIKGLLIKARNVIILIRTWNHLCSLADHSSGWYWFSFVWKHLTPPLQWTLKTYHLSIFCRKWGLVTMRSGLCCPQIEAELELTQLLGGVCL